MNENRPGSSPNTPGRLEMEHTNLARSYPACVSGTLALGTTWAWLPAPKRTLNSAGSPNRVERAAQLRTPKLRTSTNPRPIA